MLRANTEPRAEVTSQELAVLILVIVDVTREFTASDVVKAFTDAGS